MADIISVSALNKYVRSRLESDDVLFDIAIRGEVSNFSRHYKTGHCYFSLKDEKASVRAVMFAQNVNDLSFNIENGMLVVVRGLVSLYERDGTFQINVEFMFKDGVGAAAVAFEALKIKLNNEGLFGEEHKNQIPAWPHKIGLVTSKTGAALQDVLKVASTRCPFAAFVLAPVQVQGKTAVAEVKKAVQALDERVDVILVTRGGGASEDFVAFNDEELARVVFACKTPVVSAIGHEVDFTILDFVADLRAPTPSAAAEMILPDIKAVFAHILHINTNISNNIHQRVNSCYNMLRGMAGSTALKRPLNNVLMYHNALKSIKTSLFLQKNKLVSAKNTQFAMAARLAAGLNPYNVLARGYSVTRANSNVVTSAKEITPGQDVDIELRDGKLLCSVQKVRLNTNE